MNQRILLFSASFYLEPLKVAHHEQHKNLSLSCPTQLSRNYLKIFRSHSVFFLVFSVSCCLENVITSSSLTTTNLAAKTNILQDKQTRPSQQNLKNQELYLSQYCHSCYIWKIRHLDSGCSGRIDSTSVLVLDQTLITRPCNKWWYGVGAPTHCRILHVIETVFFFAISDHNYVYLSWKAK